MMDKYNFQVGEEVIDTFGRKGKIVSVCHCEQCEERGFYEPIIEWEYCSTPDMPSNIAEQKGFPSIHSMGNRVFNDYDIELAKGELHILKEQIKCIEEQIEYLSKGIEFIENENKGENKNS